MNARLCAFGALASIVFTVNAAQAQGSEPAAPAAPAAAPAPPAAPAADSIATPEPAAPVAEPTPPAADSVAPAAGSATPAPAASTTQKPNIVLRAPDATSDPNNPEQDEKKDEPHAGFFANFDLGLGYGAISGGSLRPEPGFHTVDDLSFSGPVFASTLQFGAGIENFALAGELLYEVMLTEKEEPENVGFQMFGIGVAAAYYVDYDYFVSAQLRYLGMILWREGVPCFWDRAASASGPGVGLSIGKEWYDEPKDNGGRRDKGGMGISLQGNYATFEGDADFDYLSVLLQLSMTRF